MKTVKEYIVEAIVKHNIKNSVDKPIEFYEKCRPGDIINTKYGEVCCVGKYRDRINRFILLDNYQKELLPWANKDTDLMTLVKKDDADNPLKTTNEIVKNFDTTKTIWEIVAKYDTNKCYIPGDFELKYIQDNLPKDIPDEAAEKLEKNISIKDCNGIWACVTTKGGKFASLIEDGLIVNGAKDMKAKFVIFVDLCNIYNK